MTPYYPASQGLSRRTLAAGGIVGLHVLILYALATGLGTHALNILTPPMTAEVEQLPDTRRPAEPPPLPNLEPTHVVQPVLRDFYIDDWTDGGDTITVDKTPPTPPTPPVVRNASPVQLLGQNRLPNSEDYYPPELRRQGIEGAAIVRVCVDERGARQGNPIVEESSGYARLDAGALNIARAGQYARSVQGTTPVPNCFRFHIGFQMK